MAKGTRKYGKTECSSKNGGIESITVMPNSPIFATYIPGDIDYNTLNKKSYHHEILFTINVPKDNGSK